MLTEEEKKKLAELMAKEKESKPEEPKKKSELDEKLENAKKELELKKIQKEMANLEKPEEKPKEENKYFTINGNDEVQDRATDEDWKKISDFLKY